MKQATANTFGALGYSSIIIQWFWTLLTIGMPIMTSDFMKQLFLPSPPAKNPESMMTFSLPSSVEIIIAVIAVVFSVGLCVYALLSVPSKIGRGGQRITAKSTAVIMPRIVEHKVVSKRQRRKLRDRINWTIKLLLVLAPIVLLLIPPDQSLGLSHSVVLMMGLIFSAASLGLFLSQLLLVKLWRIPSGQVW